MHVYTYSIHSLDVLRLILSYFYLICAILFVIIGLMEGGGGWLKGGGGGSAPLSPFRGNTDNMDIFDPRLFPSGTLLTLRACAQTTYI